MIFRVLWERKINIFGRKSGSEHGLFTEQVQEAIFGDFGPPRGSEKGPKSRPGADRKRSKISMRKGTPPGPPPGPGGGTSPRGLAVGF